MNAKYKGGLLFLAFVGVGFLSGLTGTVAIAPKYTPDIDREAAVIYNIDVQPAGKAASSADPQQAAAKEAATATVAKLDTNIFSNKGCIQCHTISALEVKGGATGPDLSQAIDNVPNKYGKKLPEFLQQPEGVMSEVLPTKNVSDQEKEQIVELLTKAANQQTSQSPTV